MFPKLNSKEFITPRPIKQFTSDSLAHVVTRKELNV